MPDCDYCEETFASEDAYLDHLAEAHEGELSRIDSRRVEQRATEQGASVPPAVIYGIAGLALLAAAAGGTYYVVDAFSAEPQQTVHEHGPLTVEIDGDPIQFAQQEQYTQPRDNPSPAFHVHSQSPGYWHVHPSSPGRLTISEAFSEIGVEVTESRLEIEGETYDATEEGVELSITVNGEAVDPESYELQGVGQAPYDRGDDLRIAVQTANESG